MMKKLLIALVFLLCAAALGLYAYIARLQNTAPSTTGGQIALVATEGAPPIGGAFTLSDEAGNTVTEKNLVGSKYHLLFFGFANCPDVCPGMLQTMAGVMDKLPPATAAKLQMVFISVDPDRDTAEKLGAYVRGFHKSFVGWRGDKLQIENMTKNYLAYYAKKGDAHAPDGYTMDHSAMLYVMGPDGTYITHLRNSDSATFIKERLEQLVK